MTTQVLIVQHPATPNQLVLLFHGVGSSARDLAPLGEALAPHLPDAAIVSLQAPEASGAGFSEPFATSRNVTTTGCSPSVSNFRVTNSRP